VATRRLLLIASVALILGLAPFAGRALFAEESSNPANTFTSATLSPPGTPVTNHPDPTAGTVSLTWSSTESGNVDDYIIERASEPAGPFVPIATVGEASFVDTTSAYNQQYYYRVVAAMGSWTATSGTASALSLPPVSGMDATGSGITPLDVGHLGAISISDGAFYETQAAWPNGEYAPDSYLEFSFNPVVAPSSPINRVAVTMHFELRQNVHNFFSESAFRLLVSPDDGATWYAFPLAELAPETRIESTVDVSSIVNSAESVENMRIRFQAYGVSSHPGQGQGGAPPGIQFVTRHDLVHVDVN
jgi:hypothetical protein